MKRRRNLIILVVVFVAVCVLIIVENRVSQHVDSINTTDEIILSIDRDTLTDVTWTFEEETLEFEQTDGIWYCADDAAFPVNQDVVSEFLENFEEVHATFIIDDVNDYDQYGLEDPQCTITFTAEDDTETVVSMGTYSPLDAQRYVSIDDGRVYLTEDDLLEYMTADRDEFMQYDILEPFDTLDELLAQGEVSLDIIYEEEGNYCYTDSYHYYLLEDGNYLPLSNTLTESYLGTITSLDFENYVTYTASEEDLSQYGLDQPDLTFTVTGLAEVSDEMEEEDPGEGQVEEEQPEEEQVEEEQTEEEADEKIYETVTYEIYIGTVTEEAEDEDEEPIVSAYIRVNDSEIIYELDSITYETLSQGSYDTLRPTEVLALNDWEQVTGMNFTLDGTDYQLTATTRGEYDEAQAAAAEENQETEEEDVLAEMEESAAEEEEEYDPDEIIYLLYGQEIDFTAVREAADALEINTFLDETTDRTEELSFTAELDQEAFPAVTIEIYQYDGEDCLVVMDGNTLGLMSRGLMVDLREALTSIVLGAE